jgi:hypothetical protein
MQILLDGKKNDELKTIKEMKWSQTDRQKKEENEYEYKCKRNTFFFLLFFLSHVMMIIE